MMRRSQVHTVLDECIKVMGTEKRKQAEKEQRRRAILDAARTLLLEKGYDAVSIRQIAKISELGTGTIYSYFSGKPEIYATLSSEVFDLLHDSFRAAIQPSGSADAMLRSIGNALFDFTLRYKSYYDFLDYFISTPRTIFPPEMKSGIDDYAEKVLAPIMEAVESGVREGIFICGDSRRFALLFLGMMQGVVHFRKLKGTLLRGTGFEELCRQGLETLIDSLRITH